MRGWRRHWPALLLAALCGSLAALHGQARAAAGPASSAADGSDAEPGQPVPGVQEPPHNLEPDLYLEAMQAIAEGRKSDASDTLERMVAHGPRHAGEWLDLALLQCALGHAEQAEQLFRTIESRFQPPAGIRDIIARQREQGCDSWRRQHQWTLTLGRGHDRNVNQGASNPYYTIGDGSGTPLELDPAYRPQADNYALLSADYTADLNQNGDLVFMQLYGRRNDALSAYDTMSAFAGLDHPWRWRRWRLRASGLAGALTLGGHLYQTQEQAQLRVVPPLPLPAPVELSLMTGVSHLRYRTLTNFDSNTSELRATLAYRSDNRTAQASVGAQNDHAVAARPGGNRSGWSANLYGRTTLGEHLEGELDWSIQHWNGRLPYSPGIIDQVRHQDSRTLRASLSYPLTASTSLQLEWRRIANKENISIFQYDNQVLQLSWRWHDGK